MHFANTPPFTPCIIDLDALDLVRGYQMIVANLSLRIEPGTCLWLCGNNGSGKSTILLAIAGFLAPSGGRIKIFEASISSSHSRHDGHNEHDEHNGYEGHEIPSRSDHRHSPSASPSFNAHKGANQITYIASTPALYSGLNSIQHWQLWQALFRKYPARDAPPLTNWVATPYVKSHALSRGQKQRLGLSALLCQQRSIWLLDEPFVHLDRTGCALLIDAMNAHLQCQGSIIIASHGDMIECLSGNQSCLHLKQSDPIEQKG